MEKFISRREILVPRRGFIVPRRRIYFFCYSFLKLWCSLSFACEAVALEMITRPDVDHALHAIAQLGEEAQRAAANLNAYWRQLIGHMPGAAAVVEEVTVDGLEILVLAHGTECHFGVDA